MFIGAIPKELIEQAVRVIGIDAWTEVFICCSGSFRIERALSARFPRLTIRSNDVSLLTCAIGRLASGQPVRIRFKERLDFLERALTGCGERDRVAGVLVALTVGRYAGTSTFAQRHFEHYRTNVALYLKDALDEVNQYLDGLRITDFFAGDFRTHAKRAIADRAAIIAWPPTYKGGYERLYKFIGANTDWDEPIYDVFDPKDLEPWVRELQAAGVPFWVGSDHALSADVEPAFAFFSGRNRPVYAYATAKMTSVRRRGYRSEPFKYAPVDPARLTESTDVKLVQPNAAQMNFVKDKYLSAGLAHSMGAMNFLVYLDGALAGGFIFTRSKLGSLSEIYLLSDFALARERRLSKLIALLASSRLPVRAFDRAYVQQTTHIVTTAFTDRPVSMKYRGIYDLLGRKPGFLNYGSKVRDGGPQDIYREWFHRFARDTRSPIRNEAPA